MLFTCLPPGAQIPGRFPGPMRARGKWFTIDIHCHVLTQRPRRWSPATPDCDDGSRASLSPTSAPARSTASRRGAPASSSPRSRSGSPTWTGWGSTSRRSRPRRTRPITAPTPISASPRRASSTTISPTSSAGTPTALSALGTVPFQAPELAVAELDRLHKSLGFRGIEIATNVAGEDFSAERFRKIFARIEELGLLVFMHPTGFPEARRFARPLPRQRDRQPARYDGRGASPDLWRGVARPPESEAGARRMAAAICRPIPAASTMPPRRGPIAASDLRGCRRPI